MDHNTNRTIKLMKTIMTLMQTPMKFDPGQTVITEAAKQALLEHDCLCAWERHVTGDWGDVATEYRAENELALKCGLPLLSVYCDRAGRQFWIVTSADRSVTTILLPCESAQPKYPSSLPQNLIADLTKTA